LGREKSWGRLWSESFFAGMRETPSGVCERSIWAAPSPDALLRRMNSASAVILGGEVVDIVCAVVSDALYGAGWREFPPCGTSFTNLEGWISSAMF